MKIAVTRVVVTLAVGAGLIMVGGATVRGQVSDHQAISYSTKNQPDGHVLLTVVNSSTLPITALVAVGTRTVTSARLTDRSVRFFDSVLNPFGPGAIAENQTYTFNFFGPNPPPDQLERDVQLKAALFADGSSWGDPQWVSTLVLRRSSALKYNNEALQAVEVAGTEGLTRTELANQLNKLRAEEISSAQTVAEKQMADVAFAEALLMLQDTTEADGSEVPLSESIAHARSRLFLRIGRLKAAKPAVAH